MTAGGPIEYAGTVRELYEHRPFPTRAPEDERHSLVVSPADILGKVNQYCFRGAQAFDAGFRALVAGGGTGDSAIYLAEQLRASGARVTYLDISAASMEVAQARAAVRGLGNIDWVHGSILDLPGLSLGTFDYISCLGVLHHLPDPDAGLAALASALSDRGAVALMLYGKHGRLHTYEMQEVLGRLTNGIVGLDERLAIARQVLQTLPQTNLFRAREGWERIRDSYLADDANILDDLLHVRDRPYSIEALHAFLARAGLSLIEFGTYQGIDATCRLQYDVNMYVHDAALRARLASRPLAERQSIADALDGSLSLHTFYASRVQDAALQPQAPATILSVLAGLGRQAIDHLASGREVISVLLRNGVVLDYRPGRTTVAFLNAIDGVRSNERIVQDLAAGGLAADLASIAGELDLPAALHWIVGRSNAGRPVATIPMPGQTGWPLCHAEPVRIARG